MKPITKQHVAAIAAASGREGAGMGMHWDKGPQAHATYTRRIGAAPLFNAPSSQSNTQEST
jgi:hypothetical protein